MVIDFGGVRIQRAMVAQDGNYMRKLIKVYGFIRMLINMVNTYQENIRAQRAEL